MVQVLKPFAVLEIVCVTLAAAPRGVPAGLLLASCLLWFVLSVTGWVATGLRIHCSCLADGRLGVQEAFTLAMGFYDMQASGAKDSGFQMTTDAT